MKVKGNIVTQGLSGAAQQLVFRQRHGKTIVGVLSGNRKNVYSALQLQVQRTFKQAAQYARFILQDAAIYAEYMRKSKGGVTPYNLAIADFFRPPEIGEIETGSYNGQIGGVISATIMDDFKVDSVKAVIQAADGTVLEEGLAVMQPNGLIWSYTATVANARPEGTVISFTASDLPGHSITKTKTL